MSTIKVKLGKGYRQDFWDSGNGITVSKQDINGIDVNDNNKLVHYALQCGILDEVVQEEKIKLTEHEVKKQAQEFIKAEVPKETIKEVLTPSNSESISKIKELSEGSAWL